MVFQIGVILVSTVVIVGKFTISMNDEIKCTMISELNHSVLALDFLQ